MTPEINEVFKRVSKMKSLKFITSVLLLVMVYSCSTTDETTKKNEKKVETEATENLSELNLHIEKNVSWVNLMPGSDPKFHVSGKLALLKGDAYDNESTVLKYIKIYQAGKEMYFIKPKIREEYQSEIKSFLYSTIRGLSINPDLKIKNSVDFDFIFSDGDEKFTYAVTNVMIEEAH